MLYILDSMEEIKMRLLSDDYGKHLMGVEDLLQKHSLVDDLTRVATIIVSAKTVPLF